MAGILSGTVEVVAEVENLISLRSSFLVVLTWYVDERITSQGFAIWTEGEGILQELK